MHHSIIFLLSNFYFFMKSLLFKLPATFCTYEVLCVKCFTKCRHTSLQKKRISSRSWLQMVITLYHIYKDLTTNILDWPITISTSGREHVVIVTFTVCFTTSLEEIPMSQFLTTLTAYIMLWMPHFTQRYDYLWLIIHNRFSKSGNDKQKIRNLKILKWNLKTLNRN